MLGLLPLDVFAAEFGESGAPGVVVDTLTEELTKGIDQLTRPVDAIKHQAKTVTVGISRADEALLLVPLVRAVVDAGAGRDRLGYRDLRALAGSLPSSISTYVSATMSPGAGMHRLEDTLALPEHYGQGSVTPGR